MTLRHYQIFVSVCERMNMTAAATDLSMSQSAVSQAIAELENHYGVRLFERLAHKLYLTSTGEKLLEYARHILRVNQAAEADMRSLHQHSTMRIGTSITIGGHVLPRLAADFRRTNPLTQITVVEDSTPRIERLLLQDKVDLGLVEGEITSPELLESTFMQDDLVLICSPQHRFANWPAVPPTELEKEAFILHEKSSSIRKVFEEQMEENGLTWKVTWICNSVDTIKNAVAANLGVSVISGRSVSQEVETGHLCAKRVDGLSLHRTFRVVYHKNKYVTECMRQFVVLLKS